jgi:hypothetical protein
MIVHRSTRIFSVIQHADSLSIYPTYAREDTVPSHKRLFTGLISPRYLADGNDYQFRLWVFDGGDQRLKGYDGGEFLEALPVEIQHADPRWQNVAGVAADNAGRVFVAERGANRIYRYEVSPPPGPELDEAGELAWVSQNTGAKVADIAFAEGRIVLLDDGLLTLQLLDPAGQTPAVAAYFAEVFQQPARVTANAAGIFVLDSAGPVIWQIGWDLTPGSVQRVNEGANQVLKSPTAIALNDDKVYVADGDWGRIFDYEKRR